MRQPQDYTAINPVFIESAVKQNSGLKSDFIESNVHFILQLATAYLVNETPALTTDKLTEILLKYLIHDTLKTNFVGDDRLEPRSAKEALNHSPQLWTILSLDKHLPVQKIAFALGQFFNLSTTTALRIIWSSWARSVYRDHLDRFVSFAENIMNIAHCDNMEEMALKGIHAVEKFCHSSHLPMTFEELDIFPDEADLEELITNILRQESLIPETCRTTIRLILTSSN